jgi:rsbT co-antagonist protein RsbR
MSDPSNPLFVTQAAVPMALVASGQGVVATSRSWDRLLAASPPRPEVRLQVTPLPEPDQFLVVAVDCSDLRAEVTELRDRIEFMEWQALSLSTFAKVIAHAPIILSSIDATGVSSMSDGKGLELVGRKPGELVGKNELDAARGTPTHEHLLRALRGETVRALAEPATGVFFETWYTPLRNENDAIEGVIALAIDATQRVKSHEQLVENTRVIERQSKTIRDLAAPIIKVWDEVICLPIIGAVDGARATEMMEHLLESIVEEKARFAILDLTGVGAVDSSSVHHILRMFRAARALGVEGVLSGAQPLIAQTMVSLGMDLDDLRTVRTLHDALSWCLAHKQTDRARGRADRPDHSRPHIRREAAPPRRVQ